MIPASVVPRISRRAHGLAHRGSRAFRLQRLRLATAVRGRGGEIGVHGFRVRILDPRNAWVMAKDIFENEIYGFEARSSAPTIIDCGSNIGMSVLYFKMKHPTSRITAFEADPAVFRVLEENIRRNGLTGVDAVQAAVSSRTGVATFVSEHDYDGTLGEYAQGDRAGAGQTVPLVRFRDLLEREVDFAKLNIEGAELEVVRDAADRLGNVKEIVIEYHHEPGLARSLHEILGILDAAGFEYLVHDFDQMTNPGSHPPFRLGPEARYYLLIYGRRAS